MSLAYRHLPSYTYEDYREWKGDSELIEGNPSSMAPSPLKKHQDVAGKVFFQLFSQIANCENCQVFYEIDWIISNETVVRPDIVVVCHDTAEDFVRKTPGIVFEIVSKATSFKDESLKFELYEREGVKYYVLVYPEEERLKVYKLINGRFINVFDGRNGNFTFDIECVLKLEIEKIW